MYMADVKSITIPEGSVKQIKDSNGNIIWGSQDAYPYRRLSWIHFSGAEYIDTNFTPWNNFAFIVQSSWPTGSKNQYHGHGKITSNNRCFVGVDGNGYITYGSGAYSASASSLDPTRLAVYQVNTSSSSAGKFYCDNVQVGSDFACNYQESNRLTLYIGAVNRGTSDYSYCTCDVANAICKNNISSSTPTIARMWWPAQRKSDGVCGLYDTVGQKFYPMVGTNITSAAAGPVADEYWNLM